MAAPVQSGRGRKRRMNAEINVVPYIDVMLVLLIIFMVTAPLMTQGIDVDLPDANAESMTVPEDPPTLEIMADGSYKLNGDVVDDDALASKVQELIAKKPDTMILVNGDAQVPYQFVAQGMAILRSAGATKIGFVTEEADVGNKKKP
ncbi:ExbD/TolR family protein [Solimonas marina]|uniref:Tol-Pal system protein TolR n=1 Tax=Solimonas marina TaxID=2714601 RepID=A0A969WBM4_9GAMM|nr:biopolymer transporter ExbD [Solimonas marina]NKF24182.1 biopolymer transporter ExbD [Solimonas marina]